MNLYRKQIAEHIIVLQECVKYIFDLQLPYDIADMICTIDIYTNESDHYKIAVINHKYINLMGKIQIEFTSSNNNIRHKPFYIHKFKHIEYLQSMHNQEVISNQSYCLTELPFVHKIFNISNIHMLVTIFPFIAGKKIMIKKHNIIKKVKIKHLDLDGKILYGVVMPNIIITLTEGFIRVECNPSKYISPFEKD